MESIDERPPEAQRQGSSWIALLIVAFAILLFGAMIFMSLDRDGKAGGSRLAIGGPFTLTATDGSAFTDGNLKGKPFAIFFGFTRCPDVCPTTLARMVRLRQQLGQDGGMFDIVFVSVDPGHDTPKDIGSYLSLFPTQVIGLTGTAEQIAQIAREYGVFYEKQPVSGGDYTINHTATVYLMDAKGDFQSTIAFDEGEPSALAKIKHLIGQN